MLLVRLIYFLLIGWWAGLLASAVGYLLSISIIGLPFGLILLNRLPVIIFMQEPGEACPDGYNHRHINEELPFLLRVVWFIFIGWELGFFVISIGYLCCITVIGIPLGIWILNRVPLALTLSRHYD